MALNKPALTIGLEEELFLIDSKSGALCSSWPQQFSDDCTRKYPDQIVHEFLNCQVELISSPHQSIGELHKEFRQLRAHLIKTANEYGMDPIAASTHPKADWREQSRSESERYTRLEHDLQLSAKRMLIGGMHIHIGVEEPNQKVQLLNYLTAYLPLILCLSTSSPFWTGIDSGLNSSRLSVLQSLPRSGLPEKIQSYESYQRYVDTLIQGDVIESAKEIWWDIRLNAHYPTVEVRIADTCSSIEDVMALCALVQSLSHHFMVGDKKALFNQDRLLVQENRWRAQRYSMHDGGFLLTQAGSRKEWVSLVDELIELLREDAQALNCHHYLNQLKNITAQGTSADKQRRIYSDAIKEGASQSEALGKVVDLLKEETAREVIKVAQKKTPEVELA